MAEQVLFETECYGETHCAGRKWKTVFQLTRDDEMKFEDGQPVMTFEMFPKAIDDKDTRSLLRDGLAQSSGLMVKRDQLEGLAQALASVLQAPPTEQELRKTFYDAAGIKEPQA